MKKLHRMIAAASRKFIPEWQGETLLEVCQCGQVTEGHEFIGSTLGMATTSVFRCSDGKLSTMVI